MRYLTTLLVAGCLALSAAADTIYAPPKAATKEGNRKDHDALGRGDGGPGDVDRFQEVYGAALFPGGPELITQIAFRPADGVSGTWTFPDLQFTLSTTTQSPGSLSTDLDSNIGSNATVVFSGSLTWTAPVAGAPGSLTPWYFVVNLTTPFLYDPSQGNLLLEVDNLDDSIKPPVLDAQHTNGKTVSSDIQLDDDDAGTPSNRVLETRFEASPVPEPSGFFLLGSGASGLGLWLGRRRCRRSGFRS